MLAKFTILLVLVGCYEATGNTCEKMLPQGLDTSICDDIQSVVFTLRYAIQDIDSKVKETVVVSLKEARKILNSTVTSMFEDTKSEIAGQAPNSKPVIPDVSVGLNDVAQTALKNIHNAVQLAKIKIYAIIGKAVAGSNDQKDKITAEALTMLQKILTKRSIPGPPTRRNVRRNVQNSLNMASAEIKGAMTELVKTSIHEFGRIMDHFLPLLKSLFKQANVDGEDIDENEQSTQQVFLAASANFIKHYDSLSKFAVIKAIENIEVLLRKAHKLAEKNPNVLTALKSLLQSQTGFVTDIMEKTKNRQDLEIKAIIEDAAKTMVKDFKHIQKIIETRQ